MDKEHRESHAEQSDQYSHLKPGGIFSDKARRSGKILLADDSDNLSELAQRQKGRSVKRLENTVHRALANARVVDPIGGNFMKVSFKEFESMRQDPEFVPFSKYGQNLIFYSDGTPRKSALRPIAQNEVGIWRGKLVHLKDAGPDDYGEGKYHQVPETIKPSDSTTK